MWHSVVCQCADCQLLALICSGDNSLEYADDWGEPTQSKTLKGMQTKQSNVDASKAGFSRFAHMWLQGPQASSDRSECHDKRPTHANHLSSHWREKVLA